MRIPLISCFSGSCSGVGVAGDNKAAPATSPLSDITPRPLSWTREQLYKLVEGGTALL